MSAGASLRTSVAVAARRLTGPLAEELDRTAWELEMGAGTEAALERLRSRAASQGVALIVAAMQVQRRSGGDLAKVLRGAATALEQDRRVIEEANTATAQARFTAMVVVALPLCGIGLGALASPGLPARMTASPVGVGLLLAALSLQVCGALIIRRLARSWTVSLAAVCAAAAALLLVLGSRDAVRGARPLVAVSSSGGEGRLPAPLWRSRRASARCWAWTGSGAGGPRGAGRSGGQSGQSAARRLDRDSSTPEGSSHCSERC